MRRRIFCRAQRPGAPKRDDVQIGGFAAACGQAALRDERDPHRTCSMGKGGSGLRAWFLAYSRKPAMLPVNRRCRARRPFLGAATSATGSAAPRHTKTGRCAGRKRRDGKPVPYRKTFRCHSEERMRRRIFSEPGSERFFGHFMPSHLPAGGRLRGQPKNSRFFGHEVPSE